MQKRGQITVFIIIGIVLVLVLGGIVTISFFASDLFGPQGKVNNQITNFVETCMERSLEEGIQVVSYQGGFFKPEKTLLTENLQIGYGFFEDKMIISKESVAEEVAKYIDVSILSCLDNFEIFSEKGITVKIEGEPKTELVIANAAVEATLNLPLLIEYREKISELSKFTITEKSKMSLAVDKFVEIATNFDNVQPSKNPVVNILSYDEYDQVVSLKYLDGFSFYSAVRLSEKNLPPRLNFIPDQVLKINEPFNLFVKAFDPDYDPLIFSSTKFDIQKDGTLDFVPEKIGTFMVTIKVDDLKGGTDSQVVRFVIE